MVNEEEALGDRLDDLHMLQNLVAKLGAHQPASGKA